METREVGREVRDFVLEGFAGRFGGLTGSFGSEVLWQRIRELGTELWLDTGSIEDAQKYWTGEFSALTTNNTLLNREVQTGRYDSLVREAAELLDKFPQLDQQQRMLEFAFILNARHGLKLVEQFDAYVSVEEHTDLANDAEAAVEVARRYHEICPERFIVKIPFTPAGLLATRRLSDEGIEINHTLGFSARQNYVIARVGRPAYVNVFMGRLGAFVTDNKLGDGSFVGEKATLASQAAVRQLRFKNLSPALQIGASFRAGTQVKDLAGMDVMTMPPKVAGQFLSLGLDAPDITDQTNADYSIGVNSDVDRDAIRLDTLWDIGGDLVDCVDELEKQNLDNFTPDDLIDFFVDHGCCDVLVRWSESQIQTSTAEGKIPQLANWREALSTKAIGLDSLMNLAGLNSFRSDQNAMDERVKEVLSKLPR